MLPVVVVDQSDEATEPERLVISEKDIAALISERISVPLDQLVEEEVEKLLKLEDRLHERVIGQDRAVSTLADAVRRGRIGLKDASRPTGVFPVHGADWCRKNRTRKGSS